MENYTIHGARVVGRCGNKQRDCYYEGFMQMNDQDFISILYIAVVVCLV